MLQTTTYQDLPTNHQETADIGPRMSNDLVPWMKGANDFGKDWDWVDRQVAEMAVHDSRRKRRQDNAENQAWESTLETIKEHGLWHVSRVYLRWRLECWRYGDDA